MRATLLLLAIAALAAVAVARRGGWKGRPPPVKSTTTTPKPTTTKKPLVCIDMYKKPRQPAEKWFSYDCKKKFHCKCNKKKCWTEEKKIDWVKKNGKCKPPAPTKTTTPKPTTTTTPKPTTTKKPLVCKWKGKTYQPGEMWFSGNCKTKFTCKCKAKKCNIHRKRIDWIKHKGKCVPPKITTTSKGTTTTTTPEPTTTTPKPTTTKKPLVCIDMYKKERQPGEKWFSYDCKKKFKCKCNKKKCWVKEKDIDWIKDNGKCVPPKTTTTAKGTTTTTTRKTTTTSKGTTTTTPEPTTTTKGPLVCIDMYGKERQPGEKWFSYDCKKKFKCKCNKKKCWVKEKSIDWIKHKGKCVPPKTTTTAKGTTTTTPEPTTTTAETTTTTSYTTTKGHRHPCGKDENGDPREDGDSWWNKRCTRKFRCKCNKRGKKCRIVKKKKNYAPWKGGCRKPCPLGTARRGRKCVPIVCEC